MLRKLIVINMLGLSILLASSPARPGVTASEKVIQYTSSMASDYMQGGLVAKMQRIKQENIRSAREGNRDLREVYMSFPVILGSYTDNNDQESHVSSLQEELFDGPWPSITMAEHYAEMSYNQFHLSGTVYGWYELSSASVFYEGSQSPPFDNGFYGPPGGVGEFLKETLDSADVDIDFSQYDNDGPDGITNSGDDDGYVDATFFVHSGPGGEAGGPAIWSHRWTYSGWWGTAYQTNDIGADGTAIKVNDYIMQPIAGSGGSLIEIGVFSHEFGHALGLPDLYDTDYSSSGVGDWCLMAGGSYTTSSSPVHLSAWCKEMLGWIVPGVPSGNISNLEFPNVEENAFAVKLWTEGQLDPYFGSYSHGQDVGQEYFLIENRQFIGSEQYLAGDGLLIWHIDNSRWTNSDENHRMVDVVAADDHFYGSNAGDPWPGTSNNRNFDFETSPSSIGWGGVNTEVALLNISDSDSTMFADIEVFEVNPHLSIADMMISDATGDHIYAPGEYVELWLIVGNVGATANNITATLSVSGDQVTFIEDVINFNSIDFLAEGTSTFPFEFIVNDTLSSQAVAFNVAITSDEIVESENLDFTLMLGWPQVAIIDDDGVIAGEANYLSYYSDALMTAGLVYTVWDVADYGLPDSTWLQGISKLIWYTGDNGTALDSTSISLISSYLDNGGKILMSGQDLSNGGSNVRDFLATYFSVSVSSDDINTTRVYGNTDHDMMTGSDRFTFFNTDGAYNQDSPDAFDILEGGLSLFYYPLAGSRSCGSTVKNTIYSSIFLGFGLEALAPLSGEANPVRAELMGRMLAWLDLDITSIVSEPIRVPRSSKISAAYPNPFNPQVHFMADLQGRDRGEVRIFDLRGAVVESFDVTHSGVVSWQPSIQQAGGLYFVEFRINGKRTGVWQKITYLK